MIKITEILPKNITIRLITKLSIIVQIFKEYINKKSL